jgi:hypothetical protein
MFRFFLRLNIFGSLLAYFLLILFILALVLPVLTGFGIFGHPTLPGFSTRYLFEILSAQSLQGLISALIYSGLFAALCAFYGVIGGFFTAKYFTGKFVLLIPITFLLVAPEFLSFLINIPVVALFFGSRDLTALTYGGSLSWGFALSLFIAHAFFLRISTAEIRTATMLGANSFDLILQYVIPRARRPLLFLTFFLTCQFMCQGLYTARYALKSSDLFFWHLFIPDLIYKDPGPGALAYGILLVLGTAAALSAITYAKFEFSVVPESAAPSPSTKAHKKQVTRKKKKRKKSKKKNAEIKMAKSEEKSGGLASKLKLAKLSRDEETIQAPVESQPEPGEAPQPPQQAEETKPPEESETPKASEDEEKAP